MRKRLKKIERKEQFIDRFKEHCLKVVETDGKTDCPKCGSLNTKKYTGYLTAGLLGKYECKDCGYGWGEYEEFARKIFVVKSMTRGNRKT